jgi:hypothetical protein
MSSANIVFDGALRYLRRNDRRTAPAWIGVTPELSGGTDPRDRVGYAMGDFTVYGALGLSWCEIVFPIAGNSVSMHAHRCIPDGGSARHRAIEGSSAVRVGRPGTCRSADSGKRDPPDMMGRQCAEKQDAERDGQDFPIHASDPAPLFQHPPHPTSAQEIEVVDVDAERPGEIGDRVVEQFERVVRIVGEVARVGRHQAPVIGGAQAAWSPR